MNYNSSGYIHETVVKDIIDVIGDIKDSRTTREFLLDKKTKSFKSINQATSNLVLTFPVLVSKTIPVESAVMISKAIERKCTVLLQILFSAVALDNADNAIDFVKKYHNNLDERLITIDDFITATDLWAEAQPTKENFDMALYEAVKEDMKNINFVLPESISEYAINNYKVQSNPYSANLTVLREAPETKATSEPEVKLSGKDVKDRKDVFEMNKNRIISNDIKKANELVPTTMIIDFISKSSDGDRPVVLNNIIIGVKAKLYPLDSNDIINRLTSKNTDRNGFNKFIRATTREISFWKDLVFAIDKAKIDALSTSSKGSSSKLWKVLERRSMKSKVRRSMGKVNDASAITTLVLSQEEVEYLKKYVNIDIENPAIIRPIMESYNLMGVCITDEATEVAKFLFDTGDDNYEVLSYTNLEREAADNSYKKVVNLMTKVAR